MRLEQEWEENAKSKQPILFIGQDTKVRWKIIYKLNLKIPNRQYWSMIWTIKATGSKKVAIFPINSIKNVNDAEQKPVGIRGDKFLHYSQGYRRHVWI